VFRAQSPGRVFWWLSHWIMAWLDHSSKMQELVDEGVDFEAGDAVGWDGYHREGTWTARFKIYWFNLAPTLA
jgi:hypothetical protein